MTLVSAAIKTSDGKIWTGKRHCHCFDAMAKGIGYECTGEESEAERRRWLDYKRDEVQGFLTDKGEFLDREQSFEHAKANGQFEVGFVGARVWHKVRGYGKVLHVEPITVPKEFPFARAILGKDCRVHVLFDGPNPDVNLWMADDELERVLLGGGVFTSEEVW